MKEKKKAGRFLAKKPCKCRKRRKSWILVLLVILVGACFLLLRDSFPQAPTETTAPQETTEATRPSQTTEAPETVATTVPAEVTEAPAELDPLADYRHIFDIYAKAVAEDWDIDQFEANNISYMVMFLENLDRLGYYLVDLNGDGVEELIISDSNVIYDFYANVAGQIVWVFSGAERSSWMLCEGNVLKNNGSNGAASSEIDFYTWDGAQLVLQRNISFNGMLDNPWSTTVGEETQSISEQEATELTQSYGMVHPPIEKFP